MNTLRMALALSAALLAGAAAIGAMALRGPQVDALVV